MKKFTIETDSLKTILDKVGQAVVSNNIIPALKDVLVEINNGSATFTTSDAEMTIAYDFTVNADFEAKFLIPFDFLNKVVALNKKTALTFSIEKKGLKIEGPNDSYQLSCLTKLGDFPKLPEVPTQQMESEVPDILPQLRTALVTVSKDMIKRPNLCKVLLELRPGKVTVASTDGSFMVYSNSFDAPVKGEDDLLIAPKVIKAIEGVDNIVLSWSKDSIAFVGDNIRIIITRPGEKFANFRSIFPPDFDSNLVIEKDIFIDALNKCSLSSDWFKTTVIYLKGKIKLSANDSQYGININVDIEGSKYTGEVESIQFSADKMLKLLHQVPYSSISLAIHNANKAILLRSSEDEGYLSLLMPLS